MKQCRMDCIHIDACRRFADNSTYWNSGDCPIYKSAADVVPGGEVAREIEEFEKKVGKIYNHYVFEDTDYSDDDVAVEAAMNALSDVLSELAELKKKYTEGKE